MNKLAFSCLILCAGVNAQEINHSLNIKPPLQLQYRSLPGNSLFGDLNQISLGNIIISDKTYGVSPGIRIFNESNIIILPNMLTDTKKIAYTLDVHNNVNNVWLLTSTEKEKLDIK